MTAAAILTATHEELESALQRTEQAQLIAALRALITKGAWELTVPELRDMLREIAHSEKSSHAEVYNALVNGA